MAFNQLGGDRYRQIDGFLSDLLHRAPGFVLNLPFGVPDDPFRLFARLLPQLFAQFIGFLPGFGEDRFRFDASLPDDLRGFFLNALQLQLGLPRVIERLPYGLLTGVQSLQQPPLSLVPNGA